MARAIARVIESEQQQPQAPVGPLATPGPKPVATVLPSQAQMPQIPLKTEIIPSDIEGQAPRIYTGPERQLPTTRLERAAGVGEMGLMGATGSLGTIAGGISGAIAAGAGAGSEQAARNVEEVQRMMTYQPRGRGAAEALGAIEYGMEKAFKEAPIIPKTIKGFEKFKTYLSEHIGPTAAAAVGTLPTAITELGALKVARNARKKIISGLLKKADAGDLVDADGMVKNEIKQAIDGAGLNVNDVMPDEEDIIKKAEQLGITAASKYTQDAKLRRFAKQADVDPEIVKIARQEGVLQDMPVAAGAKGYTFSALHQGLASRIGSPLAKRERKYLETLGKKAESIISEFGGTTEKTELSDLYREKARQTVKELEEAAEKEYQSLSKQIIQNAGTEKVEVATKNVMDYINGELKKLPDESHLSPVEKLIKMKAFPKKKIMPDGTEKIVRPTYESLDRLRREIGDSLSSGRGRAVFKNAQRGKLEMIYGLLSADQQAAAAKFGLGDKYSIAKKIVRDRKIIENQIIETLGKEYYGNITTKARKAILDLGKNETKAWDQLSDNIPKEFGKDQRLEIFATALGDALSGPGYKKGQAINYKHFDDYMNSILKNKGAVKRIVNEIGEDNFKRLTQFHKLVGGARRAFDQRTWTGRTLSVPGIIDEVQTMTQRLFGIGEKVGKRTPGLKTLLGAGLDFDAHTPRHVTASELLDSPKFRNLVFQQATGQLDTPKKVTQANKVLQQSKSFKKWMTTLKPGELKDLSMVGAIGYLAGQTGKKAEEMMEEEERQ